LTWYPSAKTVMLKIEANTTMTNLFIESFLHYYLTIKSLKQSNHYFLNFKAQK
jgi:hypothetical protein